MKKYVKTEIIENFIKENSLSKTKFCKMCKISPSTLKKIMTEDTDFGVVALFKIARVLNVHIRELVY